MLVLSNMIPLTVLFLMLISSDIMSLGSTNLMQISSFGEIRGLNSFLNRYLEHFVTNVVITDDHSDLVLLDRTPCFRTSFDKIDNLFEELKDKPQSYIIEFDLANFTALLNIHSDKFFGTATYFVITKDSLLIEDIADTLWKSRLPFSFIIYVNQTDSSAKIFTLNIEDCGDTVVSKYITTLNNDSDTGANISEWDLKYEFENCPLYVIWGLAPPYVNGINTSMDGIFIELLNALGSISKRKIVYRPADPIYIDELSASYLVDAVLEDLGREFADIYAGPTNIQMADVLQLSPVIVENSFWFLTPRPVTTLWKATANMEVSRMSGLVVLLHVGIVLIFHYFPKNEIDKILFFSLPETTFLFSGILLGVPSLTKLPTTRYIQIFLGIYLLQSMVFAMLLQGVFVSSLSGTIYGKPIENIDELLESNLPIKVLNGIGYLFTIAGDKKDLEVARRIENLEGHHMFDAGNVAVRRRDFATVIDAGYLIMRPNILKSFNVFEVYTLKPFFLAMPKNAYFVNKYNEWICRVIEIGIISKYARLYEHFYALKNFVEEDKRSFVVTFDQIYPAIIILGIGYLQGFICFLGEILISKCKLFRK